MNSAEPETDAGVIARIEFESRLAEVNACAKVLRELVQMKVETGFMADGRTLLDIASRLAWANNYLTVASLALVTAAGAKPFVALPQSEGTRETPV